ncbi:MAG: radical SAM protein [Candidatus Omnitrophota bacterium]
MKVLLINPLSQSNQWENDIIAKQHSCGILYIASFLRRFGHDVRFFERKFAVGFKARTADSLFLADKQLYKYIENFHPDYIGITAATAQIMDVYRCAKLVKEYSKKIKIIIGGPHSSAEPERSLKQCMDIDAACIGEGEQTMLEFVEGYPLQKIRGIVFRDNGEIKINEAQPVIKHLDTIPFPAYDLLNFDFYFSPSSTTIVKGISLKGTSILTQRGCPYSCSFCQNPMLREANAGRFHRCHSPDYVAAHISHLLDRYKVKTFLFDDPVFLIDKKRTLEICNMLIKNKFNKKLSYGVHLRTDNVDEEVLKALKQSGCIRIVYGLEANSFNTLRRMNKNITPQDNLRAIRLTKKQGICCVANIIVGTPGETEHDFIETIKSLVKVRPDWIRSHKFYPLPGTLFYKQLLKEGKVESDGNWEGLYDKMVLGDVTFADMSYLNFERLRSILDKKAVLPVNYLFKIKENIKTNPIYALHQFFLMIGHILFLYLSRSIRKKLLKIARIKPKYEYLVQQ